MVMRDQVLSSLREGVDAQIGVNLVDRGLIRRSESKRTAFRCKWY